MKRWLAVLVLAGCSGPVHGVLPTTEGPGATPDLVLVWVGRGAAERMSAGTWQRVPEFDYEFSVEQRRFADHWESVKHLVRRHPGYDGSAGPREQTMFFRLSLGAREGQAVPVTIASSLGDGAGHTDPEFRVAELTMHPSVSRFAPFDTYRITQSYLYESGSLVELVELNQGATPWVRNKEEAGLFAKHAFAQAPTVR